jgi:hypothetical protein
LGSWAAGGGCFGSTPAPCLASCPAVTVADISSTANGKNKNLGRFPILKVEICMILFSDQV